MKKHTLLVGLVTAALFPGVISLQSQIAQSGIGAAADDQTTHEITELILKRHAAFENSDRAAYSAFLDPAAIFAEPGGAVAGAKQVASVHPTVGYKTVVGDDNPKVTIFGQTAVAVYRQTVKRIYGDQSLTRGSTAVDTFVKKDGAWLLIAHAQMPDLLKRQPVKVNPAVLPQYVGQYEWSPGYVDTITLAGGKLMTQLTDEDKPYELKALNETTFFVDGDDDEGLIVFEKGASGSVSRYVYRTSGGDIAAKKLK
jgi:Domain of unknown function (DUF4440)